MQRVSAKQVAALKKMVASSYDGSKFLKQLLWVMIDRSKGLTREIAFSMTEGDEYGREEIRGHSYMMSSMTSSNRFTRLNTLTSLAGSKLSFSCHYGAYKGKEFDTLGMFPGSQPPVTRLVHPNWAPMRYTFWLAKKSYGHSGKPPILRIKRNQIELIDLSKPDYLPWYEQQEHVTDDFPHRMPHHVYGPRRPLTISHH